MATSISNLPTTVTTFVIVVFVLGIGAVMATTLRTQTIDTDSVNDELHDYNEVGTLPSNITLNTVEEGVKEVTKVVWEDVDAGSNTTLTEGTDYELMDSDIGQVQIYDSSNLTDYDSSADNFYFDYNYYSNTTSTGIIDEGIGALDTFGSFLGILALAIVAGIIIFVLMTRIMPAQRE